MSGNGNLLANVTPTIDKLKASIGSVFVGKSDVVELALTALLADGHLLIDDVPGVGKTLLAHAMAQSMDCVFRRIQFTPDLLPSDILGSTIFHSQSGQFVFQRGPVFANVVLADEINRTSPRTQSALLECMSDRQVTIDGHPQELQPPFLVLATQNPFEFEGTFPLPESQLDRFMLRIKVGYPDLQAEREILKSHRDGEPIRHLKSSVTIDEVLELQHATRNVTVADSLSDYLLEILHATRAHSAIQLGASTRAGLMLYRASQARALLMLRDYVTPDDIKALAAPVLSHRLVTRIQSGARGADAADQAVRSILEQLPAPT